MGRIWQLGDLLSAALLICEFHDMYADIFIAVQVVNIGACTSVHVGFWNSN